MLGVEVHEEDVLSTSHTATISKIVSLTSTCKQNSSWSNLYETSTDNENMCVVFLINCLMQSIFFGKFQVLIRSLLP